MSFTVFDKFGDAAAFMDREQRRDLYEAICEYGLFGDMPENLSPMVLSVMAIVREDIDHSKASRSQGKKGGRPTKATVPEKTEAAETEGSTEEGTTGSEAEETRGFETTETPGFQNSETPGLDNAETPGLAKPETQYNTIQDNTIQYSKDKGRRAKARFSPPTTEQVAEFSIDNGLRIDASAFCDFYASKGWKVGSSPMKDWKAAARNWARRDEQRADRGWAAYDGEYANAF